MTRKESIVFFKRAVELIGVFGAHAYELGVTADRYQEMQREATAAQEESREV